MLKCPNCGSSKIECNQMISTNPPIPVYKCYECGHEFEHGSVKAETEHIKILSQEDLMLTNPNCWKIKDASECVKYFENGGKYLIPAEMWQPLIDYIKATREDCTEILEHLGEL